MQSSSGKLIVLVAGEASGDQLGGALMAELKLLIPDVRFAGIGGPRMVSEGLECWWSSEELAVMGLAEVVSHLPRLLKLRRKLRERIIAAGPAVFIGIDSPDFNLGLEKQLKNRGVHTVHYVSPTVWAWRQGRVKGIAAATDLVMCLFPFERDFYSGHGVNAVYTGHPMADEIPQRIDARLVRIQLGLDPDRPCIAILPGSRHGEVSRLSEPLLGAADRLGRERPQLQFIAPMASSSIRDRFTSELSRFPGLQCMLLEGRARDVMAASDLVLCASGTATLEAMLTGRPMVAIYRFSTLTHTIGRGLKLLKSEFWSLPNILAGESLVPELEQDEANAQNIAHEARRWLDDHERRRATLERFDALHGKLKMNAARRAAEAVAGILAA